MFDKLPIRIIKNCILAIIIIISGVNLFNIHVEIIKDIAKQQKANYKSEAIALGGAHNKNETIKNNNMQFESDIIIKQEKEKELEKEEYTNVEFNKVVCLKFGLLCFFMCLIIVFMCISKGGLYGFRESFETTVRKIRIIVPTVILTIVIMVLYINYLSNYVGEINKKYKQVTKEKSELQYDAVNKVEGGKSKEYKGTHKSVVSDESVFVVGNKGNLKIKEAIIDKSGIDCFDSIYSKNYGINSAILAVKNGNVEVSSTNIYADSKGSTGIFATGNNAIGTLNNSKIVIMGNESAYGLSASYNGKVEASDVDIITSGKECAALMGGKENGNILIKESTIKTYGERAPIAYSRGSVLIDSVCGESLNSSVFIIQDDGNIQVDNSEFLGGLYGNIEGENDSLVFIYGKDSDYENRKKAIFTINNSKLEAYNESGKYYKAPAFVIANTEANININNTQLLYASRILFDIKAIRDYGEAGKNGGHAVVTAENQKFVGFIKVDMESSLDFTLKKGSVFVGGINYLNSKSDKVELKLDASSKVILTSHCFLTKFENEDSTNSNIAFGKYKIFVNGKPIN